MSKPKVIAICGSSYFCGKTTAAEFLEYLIGRYIDEKNFEEGESPIYGVGVLSFATPIKRIASVIMDAASDNGDGRHKKTLKHEFLGGVETRELYRRIGTFGKTFNRDIWANGVKDFINDRCKECVTIIDDLRFLNEYKMLEANFDVLFVNIHGKEDWLDNDSEVTPEMCDYILDNTADEACFYSNVAYLYDKIESSGWLDEISEEDGDGKTCD